MLLVAVGVGVALRSPLSSLMRVEKMSHPERRRKKTREKEDRMSFFKRFTRLQVFSNYKPKRRVPIHLFLGKLSDLDSLYYRRDQKTPLIRGVGLIFHIDSNQIIDFNMEH